MEIFQTIWTALTTENEVLTNIIGIPCAYLEGFLYMLLFTTLLNIEATKKQKFLYVIIVSTLSILSKFLIPSPLSAYLNIFFVILSILFVFKTNLFKAIISLFFPIIIAALIESLFAKIYYMIFHIDYLMGGTIPLHRLIGTLIVYLCMFIIYLLLKFFKVNFAKFKIENKKKKYLFVFSTIFGGILIALQIYLTTFYVSYLPFFITLLDILGLIIYFIINLYTIFTVSRLEDTTTNLEEAQLYNKTLQILHDNIRGFKHDFWNIVQGIGGYIDKDDMEGLKQYYSKLLEDCQQVNNLTALSPSVVNNPAVYNVLANKYHMADELGIKINLEVFMDLNELNINSYELTRIIGILMNNAIEASKECEEKVINVTFRKDKRKHMQLVIVENTYKDKNIDTEKIYEKGYSTKEGNTGLGLWEIRQIMKKHNNLNLYTTKTDELFSQQFEIYY